MGIKGIIKLPSLDEARAALPVSDYIQKVKETRDAEIRRILEGKSDKLIIIAGPCSADNADAVRDYTVRLAKIALYLSDRLLLIPRLHTAKPRSESGGYMGMSHSPNPTNAPDLAGGLLAARKLHVMSASESGLTAADELLYPDYFDYVSDLLSYAVIGARSVENQQHRLAASGLEIPVGMKNPLSGNLSSMLNAIGTAQTGHHIFHAGHEAETTGNPLANAVLRGFVNDNGENVPNCRYEDLILVSQAYEKKGLLNPAIIVDASHSNSNKNYAAQPEIVRDVLRSRKDKKLRGIIKGIMLESYIEPGKQELNSQPLVYGKSITDGCLGFDETVKLLYYIAENL